MQKRFCHFRSVCVCVCVCACVPVAFFLPLCHSLSVSLCVSLCEAREKGTGWDSLIDTSPNCPPSHSESLHCERAILLCGSLTATSPIEERACVRVYMCFSSLPLSFPCLTLWLSDSYVREKHTHTHTRHINEERGVWTDKRSTDECTDQRE